MSGGDLDEGAEYSATQCWDTALVTTYSEDSYDAESKVGDVEDCVFGEALDL